MPRCCEKFIEQSGQIQAQIGGGLSPAEMRRNAQFEKSGDGSWNINGCCGGGCWVVTDMRFCPYCGAKL